MSSTRPATPAGIRGARVLGDGGFAVAEAFGWAGGVFSRSVSPGDDLIDGAGLWVIPGVIDAHVHLGWTDFEQETRDARPHGVREELRRRAREATLAAGVTSARDAGGLARPQRDAFESAGEWSPRVAVSGDLITREYAAEHGGLAASVEHVLAAGAEWVKIVGTDGVSTTGSHRDSHFSRADYGEAVRRASAVGAAVLVHAWGGQAITWALEAGAASIEHGIYLTRDQARLGAESGATLVPTLLIYRLVDEDVSRGRLPPAIGPAVRDAVAAHPSAVRLARDAGMPIALGTDFGDTGRHGRNLAEIAELIRAGLTPDEAIESATASGARLLARSAIANRAERGPVPDGTLRDGAVADAVILRADPADPETFTDLDAVAGVVQAGRLVPSARIDAPTPAHTTKEN